LDETEAVGKGKMALKPPKYVKTVRDLIYWLYAELIARAA